MARYIRPPAADWAWLLFTLGRNARIHSGFFVVAGFRVRLIGHVGHSRLYEGEGLVEPLVVVIVRLAVMARGENLLS